MRKALTELAEKQKRELREVLNLEFESNLKLNLNENVTRCPHCASTSYRKIGKTHGVQRFKCKECGKTICAANNTPFYRTQKDLAQWNHYLDLMFDGFHSCVKTAQKVGIHSNTAFACSHKVLNALKQIECDKLTGIVEADETYFRLNYKGKAGKRFRGKKKRGTSKQQACVLTATNRSGVKNTLLQSTCLGRPTTKQVTDVLDPHIARGVLLLTDSHNEYPRFAKNAGVTHKHAKGCAARHGTYHVQNVNSLHSHVKHFIKPFRGVATKYLDHYMMFYLCTKRSAVSGLMQRTGSITGHELSAMQMTLK